MTTTDHYHEATQALRRAERRSPGSQQDLTRAQLHALIAVADELRNVHNELMEIRSILARSA